MPKLALSSYRLLSDFRHEIRKFIAFSERAARAAEMEPQQHQLLLALRGLPEGVRPTIGAVAERLCVQHHTAVALVDKLERQQLLRRERGDGDRREVLLRLTSEGETVLRKLSTLHWEQLAQSGPDMVAALQTLVAAAKASQTPLASSDAPKDNTRKAPAKRAVSKKSRRARSRSR